MNRLLLNTKLLLSPHYLRVSNSFMSTEQSTAYYKFKDKQIAEVRNTPLRVYETKFRQNYYQNYWRIRDIAFDNICKHVEKEELTRAQNCMHGIMADLFMCFLLPFTKTDFKMITVIELDCWYFMLDDYIGIAGVDRKAGIDHQLDTMKGKETPKSSVEIIIDSINRRIRPCYTDAQYNLYIDNLCNYVIDCSTELDTSYEQLNTVEKMIAFRDNLIGVFPVLNLIPYTHDIDITEYVDNPILKRMESLIVRHVTVANDLCSFKKELAQRENVKVFNSVVYLYNQTNSLEQSWDTIFGIMDSYEKEYFQLRSELQSQYPSSTDLHQYIDYMEYLAGGNFIWEMFTPRYNKYNRNSLKDVVFKQNFAELIPVVEHYTELFNIEKELI